MALLFLFVIFLFPVALYCSVLAAINRRATPLMISGGWDFAGLLFAMSGFLLVAGPFLAALFYQQSIAEFLLRRGGQALSRALIDVVGDRVVYWSLYYSVIIGGAALLFWWRSKSTVIYNVQPDVFENLLVNILEGKRLYWRRQGKKIYFGGLKSPGVPADRGLNREEEGIVALDHAAGAHEVGGTAAGQLAPYAEGDPQMPIDADSPHVAIDSFPLFWNFTLLWRGTGVKKWQEEIEAELQRTLAVTISEENPASGWLFMFSAMLFLIMIFTTALVIVFSILFPRR